MLIVWTDPQKTKTAARLPQQTFDCIHVNVYSRHVRREGHVEVARGKINKLLISFREFNSVPMSM